MIREARERTRYILHRVDFGRQCSDFVTSQIVCLYGVWSERYLLHHSLQRKDLLRKDQSATREHSLILLIVRVGIEIFVDLVPDHLMNWHTRVERLHVPLSLFQVNIKSFPFNIEPGIISEVAGQEGKF